MSPHSWSGAPAGSQMMSGPGGLCSMGLSTSLRAGANRRKGSDFPVGCPLGRNRAARQGARCCEQTSLSVAQFLLLWSKALMVIIVNIYQSLFTPPTSPHVERTWWIRPIFLMRNQEIQDIEALAQGLMDGYVAEPGFEPRTVWPPKPT